MISDANMYAEVFEILGCMDKQEVMKIPVNILEYIREERNKNYKTRINKYDLFNPDNIDNRTVNFLAWLMIDYMANVEQKTELIKVSKENSRRKELEKKQKYNENIFNIKRENIQEIEEKKVKEQTSIAIVEKETIFRKIQKFLKRLFK